MIDALRNDRGSALEGILSTDAARGTAFAARHGLARAYRTSEELWTDGAVDAVYISTRNDRHRDDALAAANAGKHVLCEKPLAVTVEEAREIVAASSKSDVLLGVNHNLRGAAAHRVAARAVAEGAIGRVLAARVFHGTELPEHLRTWRLAAPEHGGGAALDLTVHAVDLLRFLLGDEVQAVTAITSRQDSRADAEMSVVGVLRFAGGALATFHDSFVLPFASTAVELHGTSGSLWITDAMSDQPIATVTVRDSEGERPLQLGPRESVYLRTVQAFSSAIRGNGEPLCTGVDGLRAVEVAHAALQSASTGRTTEVQWG
jgi:1,5-anhydro-D-fructose reductase (1,5-anhydro-D-mannitol-forming)